MKDPSHRFLVTRWFVHNWFVDIGNPFKAIMHHLLIGGIIGLGHRDGVPIVSALVCMVTYWIGPTVSYDTRLSDSYDFTKLLHCIVFQPWKNIELVQKLVVALTYGWDPKVIIYPLWNRSLLMEADNNRYFQ